MLLYRDLIPWYRLVDPHEDHWDEAASYLEAFERAITPPAQTLLELGTGAGNNAATCAPSALAAPSTPS